MAHEGRMRKVDGINLGGFYSGAFRRMGTELKYNQLRFHYCRRLKG